MARQNNHIMQVRIPLTLWHRYQETVAAEGKIPAEVTRDLMENYIYSREMLDAHKTPAGDGSPHR